MNNDFQNLQVNNQQQVQNSQNMTGQAIQQPVPNYNNQNKNNKKIGILIGIAAVFLIIVGFVCYRFINMNNPTNVYKNLVKKGISEIYDIAYQNDDKVNASVYFDLDLKLDEELIDQDFIDLINKTTIGLNYQIDKKNEKFVIKIDSDYDKESLIDLQLFVDSKNQKTYLYAKDYFDKYLEIDVDDYSDIKEMFESSSLTVGQTINEKKAKKILVDELSSIIKDTDCSKENGLYVFKITEKELASRLKTALTNLKNNDKFLDCYKDSNSVKQIITSIIQSIDETSYTNQTMKFSISKKTLSNKIEKLVITSEEDEFVFDISAAKTNYKYVSDKETVLEGYIKKSKEKDTTKIEVSITIPELGTIVLNSQITYITGKDIDKVDTSKVKNINEITEAEQNEIMNKIMDSKLYEFIELISGNFGFDDDYYDDDWYDDDWYDDDDDWYDDDTSSGSTSTELDILGYTVINLNIPNGFTNTYNSETYKTYKKDDIELVFRSGSYDNADEYLKSLDSKVEYANQYDYYQNVVLSNKMSKTVNGLTYYYKDYSYDYVGIIGTTKYYEKYLCTDLGDGNYFIVEITSKNSEISDSLLNTILSID